MYKSTSSKNFRHFFKHLLSSSLIRDCICFLK